METILIIAVVSVIALFVIRELVTWYFKLNKIVEQNEEIIRLLGIIANEDEDDDTEDEKPQNIRFKK